MKKILKTIAIIIICIALFVGMLMLEAYQFNNGICRNCGAKLSAISRSKNGQTYYECPNCYYGCYAN